MTLKRFKGTGDVEPNGQSDSGSVTVDCELLVIRDRHLAAVMVESIVVVGGSVGQKIVVIQGLADYFANTTFFLHRTIPTAGLLVSLKRMATPP